jgi:hypothetical protein
LQEVIDVTNKELVMLWKELGPAVCDSVTNALKEIQTYNATGRYIVEVPWNYTTDKGSHNEGHSAAVARYNYRERQETTT